MIPERIENKDFLPVELFSQIKVINRIIDSIQKLEIKSNKDADFLSEKINEVQKCYKEIESSRLESTRIHRETIQKINNHYQSVLNPIDSLRKYIRTKLFVWQKKKEEEARAQRLAELEKAAQDVFSGKARLKNQHQAQRSKWVAIQKRWVWELLDISKVPKEYLSINPQTVNKAITRGVRSIPGIKIYKKESAINKSK